MGSLVFDSFTGGFERRIGRRVPVDGIEVAWILGPDRRRRFRAKQPGERLGCIEDASVTGARIRGPADLAVEPADRVVIRYQGHDSVVIVRHVTPTDDPTQRRYGVELDSVHPRLRRRLDQARTVVVERSGSLPGRYAPTDEAGAPEDASGGFEAAVRELGPQTCATLSMQGPYFQIPEAFTRLYGWLEERGYVPRGMPIGVYYDDPTVEPADARWQVRAPIEDDAPPCPLDDDGFAVERFEATTVASTVYRGPYEDVEPAYDALTAWIDDQGFEVIGPPMEVYLNDPGEASPEEYLTEILMPVRADAGPDDS